MASNVRKTNIPTGFTYKDVIAWGTTGLVFLDVSSNTVVKSPHSEKNEALIKIESAIYERFTQHGGHEGLLQYFGPFETGIRLQFASKQGLLAYLQDHKGDIGFEQRLRWCEELAHSLSFIHSNKVIHGDLKCNNVFLDDALHSKVADFGGSSLDGSELKIVVTASHRSPGDLETIEGDIFALGSSFYETMAGQAPYAGLEEEEIVSLFSKSNFPETSSLGPMGNIIQRCWQGKYANAYEVWTSVKAISKRPYFLLDFPHTSTTTATVFAISAICLFALYWNRGLTRLATSRLNILRSR